MVTGSVLDSGLSDVGSSIDLGHCVQCSWARHLHVCSLRGRRRKGREEGSSVGRECEARIPPLSTPATQATMRV